MKFILVGIGSFFIMASIFFVHLFFIYILPYPFSNINSIMATTILAVVLWRNGKVIWLSVVLHFFVELYSTTPFGIILLASTGSVLCGLWTYRYLVTNESWYAVAGIAVITVLLFRTCYTALLFFMNLFYPFSFHVSGMLLMSYFWEIIFTTLVTVCLYVLCSPRKRKTAPTVFFLNQTQPRV